MPKPIEQVEPNDPEDVKQQQNCHSRRNQANACTPLVLNKYADRKLRNSREQGDSDCHQEEHTQMLQRSVKGREFMFIRRFRICWSIFSFLLSVLFDLLSI